MIRNIIKGTSVILSAMILAILMTFVYQYLIHKCPESEIRFSIIFITAGLVTGLASVGAAIVFYSNNFGEGFKKKDQT